MSRVYSARSICSFLHCNRATLTSIVWTLGYGRKFDRKYTLDEVRAIMAMYYRLKGQAWHRKKAGPGIEPGGGE